MSFTYEYKQLSRLYSAYIYRCQAAISQACFTTGVTWSSHVTQTFPVLKLSLTFLFVAYISRNYDFDVTHADIVHCHPGDMLLHLFIHPQRRAVHDL